ncbi:MAG: bifunctional diaminohydroxyphosphoribosylaminopyrimidine deaminase/5-amino-6-(5-phosphoribosylamino)uracil reductase RibD [Patescibacteria group bacterium]
MHREDLSRDEKMMRETFRLARKGMTWTDPNPLVGAVVVKGGSIIARGYHTKAGAPHAEVEALRATKGDLRGSTLYVNLEPCSHYGKTPPCVDVILKAGIRHVVCATLDPDPKVHGEGIRSLRKHGVRVTVGVLEHEARRLNEAFFAFHKNKRPFVTIKFAASLDGKVATRTGDSKWITNERARTYARRLRERSQAILVGINTVLKDDPHLGVRKKGKKDPLRVILDSRLRIPLTAGVLRDNNILIVTTGRANAKKKRSLVKRGVALIEMKHAITIPDLMRELYTREIISVLVEGGGSVLGSFFDARCVDKVHCFYAPIIVGGSGAVPAVGGSGSAMLSEAMRVRPIAFKLIGDCLLATGYIGRVDVPARFSKAGK